MTLLYKLAGGAALVAAAFASGLWYGWDWRDDKAKVTLAEQIIIAHTIERDLKDQVAELESAAQLEREKHAQAAAKYRAALRDRTERLSVPVARIVPGDPAASGVGAQARAELEPETAVRIVTITDDGDEAIRQLNQCVDQYNDIRERYNRMTRRK